MNDCSGLTMASINDWQAGSS